MKVQLVEAPAPPPTAPAAPAGPAQPGAGIARPEGPPELVEAPKPKAEEAPRTKRFAGLYDRRGAPAAKGPAPDSQRVSRTPPSPPGGTLRGEETVQPPAVPPAEAAPSAPAPLPTPSPSASPAQETKVAKGEPIPSGRTSLVSPAPPAAPQAQAPPAATPREGGAPGGRGPAQAVRLPAKSFRDQVASLGLMYRPPVEDPGTAGEAAGRGEPGLETFRFKYATWGLAVKRDIERAWKVPPYGMSSLAIVRFVVLPDGKIRDLQLEKSSGLAPLDKAARGAIADAAPFRPFPPRMREENPGGIDITVNFYYHEGRGVLGWE